MFMHEETEYPLKEGITYRWMTQHLNRGCIRVLSVWRAPITFSCFMHQYLFRPSFLFVTTGPSFNA